MDATEKSVIGSADYIRAVLRCIAEQPWTPDAVEFRRGEHDTVLAQLTIGGISSHAKTDLWDRSSMDLAALAQLHVDAMYRVITQSSWNMQRADELSITPPSRSRAQTEARGAMRPCACGSGVLTLTQCSQCWTAEDGGPRSLTFASVAEAVQAHRDGRISHATLEAVRRMWAEKPAAADAVSIRERADVQRPNECEDCG